MKENKKKFKPRNYILLLYLVALPIILFPTIYLVTYFQNMPVIFKENKIPLSNPKGNGYFTFDLEVTRYKSPTLEENGELKGNGSVKIKETISDVRMDINSISISYELHSKWRTNSTGSKTNTNIYQNLSTDSTSSRDFTISVTDSYPFKPLPLMKVTYPTIYVKITFKTDGFDDLKTLYFKYEIKDFINDEVLGITTTTQQNNEKGRKFIRPFSFFLFNSI